MAHKKAAGSAKNLRDSKPKYRGVKIFGGQQVVAGNIIIRQKGNKYEAGKNTYVGKDFSIHANISGVVEFSKKNKLRFDGRKYLKTVVHVAPAVVADKKKVIKAPANKTVEKKEEVKKEVTKTPAKKVVEKKAPAKKAVEKKAAIKKPVAKKISK